MNALLALIAFATMSLFAWLLYFHPVCALAWFIASVLLTTMFCGVCRMVGEDGQ